MARVMPIYRGGKFDAEGGAGARVADLKRFEELSRAIALPVFISLTLKREGTPESAYGASMRKLCVLLSRRLGFKLWGRVLEAQTDSGDGWPHWHVVAEVAGTGYDLSAQKGRPWIDLGRLQADVKRCWCDEWGLGGYGGQDVQRVKSRRGVAGYLAKYVVKPWPAIPVWVLQRRLVRTVGFSKAANAHFRSVGLLRDRGDGSPDEDGADGGEDAEGKDAEPVRKRVVGVLVERLASSGLCCKVVSEARGFVGTIKCGLSHLLFLGPPVPLTLRTRLYRNRYSQPRKTVAGIVGLWRRGVEDLNRWVRQTGVGRAVEAEFHRRVDGLLHSWDWMLATKAREFA